jgi:hypothetical protein
MTKRFLTLLVLGCALVFAVPAALAQPSLDETFVAESGSFQFSYPADWDVQADDGGVTVSASGQLDGSTIVVVYVDPDNFTTLTRGLEPAEAAEVIASESGLSSLFTSEPELTTLPESGREAGLAPISSDDIGDGIAFIVPIGDSYGVMVIFSSAGLEIIVDNADLFIAMADSFDEVGEEDSGSGGLGGLFGSSDDDEEEETSGGLGGLLGSSSSSSSDGDETELVTSLDNVDGDYRDAIAELQDAGLIGSGGGLVFNESRAFFDSEGNFFQPLASRSPRTDVVMSATLEFTVGSSSELESCTLLARIEDSGADTINTFLQVGFDNEGAVFYFDARQDDEGDFNFADLGLDFDEPHHLLFIAADDRLTIYVDGELALADQPIEERNGTYGIALRGRGPNARCEGTNIWVYEAPAFQPGVCEVSASGTVNLRSGPGTNFDRAGTLGAGESFEVVGQAAGTDGFTWYELENDAWVREDIISLQGDCGSIPESE